MTTNEEATRNLPIAEPLRRTWLYVSLYWCRPGREGKRDLRRDKITHDANDCEYVVTAHEEATRNLSGGENSKLSAERETRLYRTGAEDDAFASLTLLVAKVNLSWTTFFKYPKPNVAKEDNAWYKNGPLGVNMMKIISVGAHLSQI